MLDDNIYYIFGLFLDPPEVDFTALCAVIDSKKKKEGQWSEDKYKRHNTIFAKLKNEKPDKKILEELAQKAKEARLKELNTKIAGDEADGVLEEKEYNDTSKSFGKYFTEKTIKHAYRLEVYHFPIPHAPPEISAGIKPTDKMKVKEIDDLLKETKAAVKEDIDKVSLDAYIPDVLTDKFNMDFGMGPAIESAEKEIRNKIVNGIIETEEDWKKASEEALEKARKNAKNEVENKVKSIYDILAGQDVNSDSKIDDLKEAINKAIKNVEDISGPGKRGEHLYSLLNKFIVIFSTENSKNGYNLALKMKSFYDLGDSEFNIIAAKYKDQKNARISKGEYEHSLKRAREEKCWEAEWCVYNYYCGKDGYFGKDKNIKPPAEPIKLDRPLQCSICGTYNKENAKVCMACGKPLMVKCPRCSSIETLASRNCSQCNYAFADMPKAVTALEDARAAIALGDVVEAEKFMRIVNTYWSECPGADEVRKNIAKVKKEQKEAQEKIDALEKEVRTALGQRKLYEAQSLFLKLRQIPQAKNHLVGEEQDVKKNLAIVQEKLAQLPFLSDIARKIDLCEEIIAVAVDCQEAQDALAKYPPLPPGNLSAKVTEAGFVDLTWVSPASRKPPMFVVVRKADAVPASPTDGQTLIDNLSNTTFTDSQCETGVYGYAVFTKRDKTIEQNGCRSNLVLKIEDVGNVSVLPGNASLTFSWKEQPGSRGMVVTRFTGVIPTGEGVRVPFQSKTGFVDSNLNNGTTYCYRFQTVFRGINGEDIRSPGKKVVQGTPQVPPKAIVDLKANESNDGATILQWSAPPQGEVFLFDVETKPEIPVGTSEWTTLVELKSRFGELIPVLAKEQTSWKNTSTGVRYLLPITFKDGLAVFGKPVTVIRIADISDLDLDYIGDRLRLTWTWPKGLQKVQISYRHDRYPDDPNDAQSAKVKLSLQEYNMENSWFLTIGNSQEYYFCVYAFVEQNTQNAFSRGVKIQTVKTTIKYDLSIRRRFIYWGRVDAKLTLTIDSRHGKFPDLIVKRNFGKPPLKRDFGMPLMDIPAKSGRKIIVPLDAEQLEDNTYMRIFVKNPAEEERYIIDDPPSREKVHLYFKKPSLIQLYGEIINRIFKK